MFKNFSLRRTVQRVGYNGTGKDTLGINIEESVVAFIEARGARVKQRKSTFGNWIIWWWIKQGAPCVEDVEKTLPPLTYEDFMGSPAKFQPPMTDLEKLKAAAVSEAKKKSAAQAAQPKRKSTRHAQ